MLHTVKLMNYLLIVLYMMILILFMVGVSLLNDQTSLALFIIILSSLSMGLVNAIWVLITDHLLVK